MNAGESEAIELRKQMQVSVWAQTSLWLAAESIM